MSAEHAPKFAKLVKDAQKRYGEKNVVVTVTKLGKGAIATFAASATHKCGVSIGTVQAFGEGCELLNKNSWARIDSYVNR